MAKIVDKKPKAKDQEETCFHSYVEHLKQLQGGDYKKCSFRDERYTLKYPSGSELTAFLDIGAEAERRKEVQFLEMKCIIDNLTKENDSLRIDNVTKASKVVSLQKKIVENENVIMSLTTKIDQLSCKKLLNGDVQNLKAKYECDKEQLYKENDTLFCQLKQLKWKFCKLKEEHGCCPTVEEMKAKDYKIMHLTECLNKKEVQLENNYCELNNIKNKKCLLEKKIISLEDQLQSQYEEFNDKSCTYQRAIDDLESQISFLEQSLADRETDSLKNNQVYEDIICQSMGLQEKYNVDQISERDRILQELIAKIELRDRNVQQLKKLQNLPCLISNKEYDQLLKLIEEQACDIERLTYNLQNKTLEDNDSTELLNEVSDLQNAVCGSVCDIQGTNPLTRRIKRIKCKIKSRLQREEARRKEHSRQLGIYRCQFVTLQKEIEELRHKNIPTTNDDIKIRLEKEKALSQIICRLNKQKRELNVKCISLTKALANIEKVNEFLMHLS